MKLILKNKLFSVHDKITVRNENDEIVYKIASKMISMADKTYVHDADGNEVAFIHRKPISIHNRYYIEMTDGTSFELSSELFHAVKDVFNIDALGWKINGNLMEHDYQIVDEKDNVIASTHRKWARIHDIFTIDITNEKDADKVIAVYVVLEHILHTRAAVRSEHVSEAN